MLHNVVLFLATWGALRYEGRSLVAIGLDQPRRHTVASAARFAINGASGRDQRRGEVAQALRTRPGVLSAAAGGRPLPVAGPRGGAPLS